MSVKPNEQTQMRKWLLKAMLILFLLGLVLPLGANISSSLPRETKLVNRSVAAETTTNGFNSTRVYGYDAFWRLVSETITTSGYPYNTDTYVYDDVGNRLFRYSTDTNWNQAFTYDARDRLNGRTYDDNGNTTTSPSGTDYYDFENRLTNRNSQAYFLYDGDGNRVGKTVAGVTALYLVDDRNPTGWPQVLAEFLVAGGTTNLSRIYGYGLDLISQWQMVSNQVQISYYGYDAHGNTRFLTATNGLVSDTYAYDAYGNLISQTGTTPNDFLYCGEQIDDDLALYYLRARYLDVSVGRFWTRDVLEGVPTDPFSVHKYSYAKANPVLFVDPSGRITVTEALQRVGIQGDLATKFVSGISRARRFVQQTCKAATQILDIVDKVDDVQSVAGIFLIFSSDGNYVGESQDIRAELSTRKNQPGDAVGKIMKGKNVQIVQIEVKVPKGTQSAGGFLRVIEQRFMDELIGDGEQVFKEKGLLGGGANNFKNVNRGRAHDKFMKALDNFCRSPK